MDRISRSCMYLDEHALLIVRVGGEDLLLARGDGRSALHEFGHDAAHRLLINT